ncbi:MAG: hypothetical protein ABWZ40_02535 [Caulobacterales bacterium]
MQPIRQAYSARPSVVLSVVLAAAIALAGAAQAAPSQKSLRKAFTPRLAGTWGDVLANGAEPTLPDGWALFACGEQPALVIAGSDKAGFTAKMNSMEVGPVEGTVSIGEMASKTSGRVTLPNLAWEQRITFKNSDYIVLDAADSDADTPSAAARYLHRCR